MALTLADASRLAPLEGAVDPEFDQWRQTNEIAGTSEVGKGWRSAGLGSRANALYTQSLKAANEGDTQNAEVLRQQAEDLDQQTAAWAPRVQNVSDVRSLRDAADWGAGALGNVRTSVAPALGSLAGAAVGLVAAPLTGGVVNPVNAGFAGGAMAGYDMETDEAIASAMRDPYIMANHTPEEILAASRVKGGLSSLLEAAVPTVMGGKVMGTMGKGAVGKFFGRAATKAELTAAQAVERAGQRAIVDGGRMGAAKAVGASVLEGGAGEFGTEFAQSLTGQGAQNYLQDKGVTDDLDYMQALNEGAAGAVAGGGMGIVGGGGEVARAHTASTKDAVAKVTSDPVGAAADFVADTGNVVGKVGAKFTDALERLASPDQRAYDTLLSAATPEQHAAAATQWAQHVLNDKDSGEADRAAAADYVTRVANGDPKAASVYRDQLTINHHESKQVENDTAEADEIAKRLGQGSKSSKVRASTEMGVEAALIAPDKSRQQLETVADIWRKQGVAEKLIKATSNVTDQTQRVKAMQMFGWIANGFKDDTGELFVPEWTVKNNGEKVGDVILSAAKVAFQQGLIGHDVAQMLPQIVDMAKKQYANNTLVRDNVIGALPEISKSMWAPHADQLVEVLRHAATHGTTKEQEQGLLNVFGSKEAIAQAMSKFQEPRNKPHSFDKEMGAKPSTSVDEDGNTVDEDGNTVFDGASDDADQEYETGMRVVESKGKSTVRGRNKDNEPFDVQDPQHKALLSERVGGATDNESRKAVGVWDRVVEDADGDKDVQHEGETALLEQYGEEYLTPAHRKAMDEYGVSASTAINEAPAPMRRGILNKINKRFQMVRSEALDTSAAADAIAKDQVGSFSERDININSAGALVDHGILFLERDGVKTPFVTSAMRLLKHAWASQKKEQTTTDKGVGVHGMYQDMLSTVAALMEADPRFNGRVGYKTEANGEIKWLPKTGKLPGDFKFSKSTKATLEMVETQRARSLHAGDKDYQIDFATSHHGMIDALREYAERPSTSQKHAEFIIEFLKKGSDESQKDYKKRISSEYRTYRGADNSVDGVMAESYSSRGPKADPEVVRYMQALMGQARKNGQKLSWSVDHPVTAKSIDHMYAEGKTSYEVWLEAKRRSSGDTRSANDNVTPSDVTTDEGVQGSIRAEDPRVKNGDATIYRDKRGVALAAEDASAAVGGNSRGGRTTDVVDARGAVKLEAESRPADEPASKKVRKLGDQLDARDWVADLLRKGIPAFNAARVKYAKDADVMKRVKAGIRVLTQMAPRGLIAVYDGNLTVAQAEAIISRAKKAMGVGDVRNNDAGVETEVRGRVDAVGRQGTEEAGAAPDKRGPAPAAELGKSLGLEGILTRKELDDAIYKEDYSKLDSVAKLQQFATYTRDLATRLEAREEAGEELSTRDEGLSSLAGQLVFEAKSFIKNPNRSGTDFDSFFDDIQHTDEDVSAFVKALAGAKQSTQTANDGTGKRATKAEREAAKQHILDTVGDTVKGAFVKHFGDNSSGSWTPGETQNVIRLALNGNVLSTSYHESMHEFFAMLKKYGNTATVKLLERVASNEILNRKLERLLEAHPEAAAQVRSSPEEAAAFLYQFWMVGQVKLGGETTGFFQKIKSLFSKITGKVSQLKLDEQAAQRVLEAFSRGDFKSMNGDMAVRDASMEALRKDTAMHEKVLDNLDKAGRDFTRVAGKLFFSSEAMLKGTKNKHMVSVAEALHQETGTARGENQGLLSAVRQHSDIWLNKLNNILTAYKPEDLELAREALSKGIPAKDRIAKEIVAKINAFNEEMYTYISSRDVRRLDPDTNKWVKVEKRKDYFTRVWDTNALQNRTAEFKALLFKHHMKDLEATAKIANNEVAALMKGDAKFKDLGPAAQNQVASGSAQTVTAEMVADAIITRLLNAKGHADLDEGGSDIGMTPLATSVNRRSLSWINDEHFDDFKSKDITNIMTSYVSSMVKRAEYTKALGHGSEKLRTGVDKAILYEMGGDELVKNAERRLPIAIRFWGKAKAAALKAGAEFTEPYPTLRSVGLAAHNVTVSSEQVHQDLAAALKHLDQGFKAIQAQEGTLGSNISAGMKSVNNVLMTYQTVRLLPLVMFSSVNDVMGIVAQGGELKDAWNALVGGMREIKLRWKDEKSQDYKALRAEGWGTVDAGSLWDTLGQAYGSSYMSDKARRFADSFFKWNGMEGWNRAMRITATSVAERALKSYQKIGFDKTDKAAVARFEELYGKNFDPKDIALDADGELDMNDVNNQAAMMRWVSSAIMSPNAAHRTNWGSDPRMASFWMLKQFAYTFHRVMLKGAVEQAKLGNYRPAAVLALGYAPVTIAADAVKEMLIPGEEPPWMQGGLDGFLAHGFDRAGVAGVPGMAYDALTSFNGPVLGSLSAMGGPTVGQLTSALVDSPSSTLLGAAPLGSLLRRAAE